MKAPEETTLNQKILLECREEVAKEKGFSTWADCMYHTVNYTICFQFHEQAAELAMEKQAEFFRWASSHKWRHDDPFMDGGYWYKNSGVYRGKRFTELELYNIWREGK